MLFPHIKITHVPITQISNTTYIKEALRNYSLLKFGATFEEPFIYNKRIVHFICQLAREPATIKEGNGALMITNQLPN